MSTNNIISTYLGQQLLYHFLGNIHFYPNSPLYLALYNDDPTKNNTGTEVSGGSYARRECPLFTVSGGSAISTAEIKFPFATVSWGTVTHMGIVDTPSPFTTNLLFYGSLSTSLTIGVDETVRAFPLTLALKGNADRGWGAATANMVLDGILNNNTLTFPGTSVYLALGRSLIYDSHYNYVSWTEISGGGYTRQQITGGMAAWTFADYTTLKNLNAITFTENATANWGNVTHAAIFNGNPGELLFWGKLTTPRLVLAGDGVGFLQEEIQVGIF